MNIFSIDDVRFGDVASQPPVLTAKPRERIGYKSSRTSPLFSHDDPEIVCFHPITTHRTIAL